MLVKKLSRGISTDAVHAIIRGDYRGRCSNEACVAFLQDLELDLLLWNDVAALEKRLAQLKV